MTARLAPALTGPAAPTVPPGTGRRQSSTPGDDFSALLGAAGDRSAPSDARPDLLETPRRLTRQARLEPRQDVRPVEERRVADRRAADDRRTDERRAAARPTERRADERRAEAQRAAGDERATRRESVERRHQEDSAARADRAALRRESDARRVGAHDARDEAETPVETRDEQAQTQQGACDATAEPAQAVVMPTGDPASAPLACHPGAAPVDPALLALAGAALDAATPQTVAGTEEGAGDGAVPGLVAAPLPQSATVPQSAAAAGAPVAAPAGDATATFPSVAPTSEPGSGPTRTDEGQGVPLADAPTTVGTEVGPVDVTVLNGATPLPRETAAGTGTDDGSQQDQVVEPSVVLSKPADDVAPVGVEGGDTAVAGPAGPTGVPSPRAEATTRADATTLEAAVERTNLGPTVADLARAAHRDGSGATRVVIRLDPPELGTVTIAVTVRGGDVRVSLLAEAGVVPVLDSRREDVHRALSDAGLALGGYDVSSGSHQGQERQQESRDRAASAGRPWRALGPEMDFERAAAVDRAARGVWL